MNQTRKSKEVLAFRCNISFIDIQFVILSEIFPGESEKLFLGLKPPGKIITAGNVSPILTRAATGKFG